MSSVWRALPFLSTPNASPLLPLALSRLLLTRTGLSYFTRLSTGGIIACVAGVCRALQDNGRQPSFKVRL